MNVVLIVCDTLRADHLGCYGYFRDTSPNLDALAEGGVLLEDFYSSGVCTGTAFTSIHTGLYPIHHKVYNVAPPELTLDGVPTLATLLRREGFTTAAFDNLAYNRNWSRDPVHYYRGFESYITDISDPQDWNDLGERVRADWYNERLIPWIERHAKEQFFAFVHYWDVHQPYTQPESYRNLFQHKKGDLGDLEVKEAPAGYRYVPGWGKVDEMYEGYGVVPEQRSPGTVPSREASIDLYDGSVSYLDRCIGDVVDVLKSNGVFEDTLIVVTADHGELLGQHGIYTHVNLYDANIRIPLIVSYPAALVGGRRISGFGSQVDVLPTTLDLAGVRDTPRVDGISLWPLMEGATPREEIFAEDGGGIRSVQAGDWKLIHYYQDGVIELYDMVSDPMEVQDLAEQHGEKVAELKGRLDKWVESSLGQGQEDPLEYVMRNTDFRKAYRQLFMDGYRATGFESAEDLS